METTITQISTKLGIVLFDKDGTTALYKDVLVLSPGLQLPQFPEVGGQAEFNVGGTNHQATIIQKIYHYDVQTGAAIAARLTIVAHKNANAPIL